MRNTDSLLEYLLHEEVGPKERVTSTLPRSIGWVSLCPETALAVVVVNVTSTQYSTDRPIPPRRTKVSQVDRKKYPIYNKR